MRNRALLLLILAIAAFLRLYRLSSVPPGLYHDEAMNGNNALEVLETGRFQVFYPENNGREGLYINIAAGFIRVLGTDAWVLRLPAALFGILTVWGLYLLAAEILPVETALLASFFLATCFWHILFSRMAFRAIAAPMFLAWTLAVVLRARRSTNGSLYWTLAGILYGLGFYTYIAYRATPLLVAALLLLEVRKRLRGIVLFSAVTTVIVGPLLLYFAGHPGSFLGRTSQVAVWRGPHPAWEVILNVWRTGRMFFTRGDYNWRHNVAWRAEIFWPVAVFLVVGVAVALRHPRKYWIPLGWLVVAAVPVVLSNEGVPHALRAVLMVPGVCLLAAIGASWTYTRLASRLPRALVTAAVMVLLAVLCYEPWHTYFRVWAPNPNVAVAMESDAGAVAEEIRRLPVASIKVVVAQDPIAAQPVMFLTGSYTPTQQERTGIRYRYDVTCGDAAAAQPGARVFCLGTLH